jgi:vacuolar-type H+-ATPase subunit F/Vma7
MTNGTLTHVDEALAEVKRLAGTTVPKQAEVRQLYTAGDIVRIGVLAADAVKQAHSQVAEANIALIMVVEQLAKSLREDVEQQNHDMERQSELLREKIIAITEAAKVAKDNIVAAQAQMMLLVEQPNIAPPREQAKG